ncbi:Ribosome-recycling factor, mitochondrial [Pichia kudriavzevii]|uniref:Ribosome-recycling factor, mitochondrial n=1 Tax=Pichia kudriavzevii TaxID=4909 RepID=A0A1V2LMQ4_PICKU|nr:Ribosome-recycling factor, mitochondrial [Pichia kudriavzevii]
MSLSVLKRAGFVPLSSSLFSLSRTFSTSPIVWAKKDKKGKKDAKKDAKKQDKDDEEEVVLDPKAIIRDLKVRYDTTFDQYSKKLTELKMGKANPAIFDKLKVKIDDSYTATFPEIAMTAMKGTNFLNVTVFDPSHSKRIISAILEANMNLNPEVDPKNPQLLKIKLPNSTKELKAKQIKEMKELHDYYKSNAGFKDSLIAIRAAFMKDLKNVEGSKDIVKKLTTEIDSTYKTYADKLSTALKNTEKSLN